MVRKLTDKQAAFVAEYLVDLNATQAAIRAGYSERTAYRIGAELLQKTSVAEAIAAGQAKRAQRVEITARRAEPSEIVDGLDHLEGCELAVLADGSPLEGLSVHEGRIEIPYPARVVHAGLPFASVLSPLPVETDAQTGSTLGKRRGYGKCVARLFRSVGGRYGAERDILYDFPFLPERYDEPCEPFSGDMEFTPGGGQEAETSVWLVQDRPMPMHIVALMCDVDFGEV